MKQFVLILMISLPSLVLAQAPTFTFTPTDGQTNVSTTADLLIESSAALRTTAGNNLNDTNVIGLVELRDESNNLVDIGLDVNPGRTDITIDPVDPLLENHTYTLTIFPVENNNGDETTTQSISFTTGDFTAPSFSVAKGIMNSGSGFTFRVNVNEDAVVYYVVDRDGTTPSVGNIRNGNKADGSGAEADGSFFAPAGIDTDAIISSLDFTPPVKFNIYFFAEDDASPVNVTTAMSRGLPLLNSSSISDVGKTDLDLRVNIDEAVTTHYVVTLSPTQPTSQQIIAGQDDTGGTPVASGNFATPTGNVDHNITGLDDLTTYYVHFVATDGADNETVVKTETTTTLDGTGPVVVTLNVPDNSVAVDISTSTFTITFDEAIRVINTAPAGSAGRIELYEDGVLKEDINRNDTGIGMDGSITTSGSTATIQFVYDLLPHKNYYILVGDQVFEDTSAPAGTGNLFAGLEATTDWNFTTSGVTINNATSSICSGSFQQIADIIISETGAGDFNDQGGSRSLVLSLANTSDFAFSNAGVSVTGLSADITVLSFTVGLTSLTINYTVDEISVVDNITVSGLKVYATGNVTTTTIIRTGGTADQDGNNGLAGSSLTHATINVGASPPAQPALAAAQDLNYCVGEDVTGNTLELVDQGPGVTYNWYRDAALTDLAVSASNVTVNVVSDLGLVSPSVLGDYTFYVIAVGSCQSAPPVEVLIEVGANPVADAGNDRTGVNAVCTGTALTLGGNPTLVQPSAPGAYTYSWEYVEGTPEPDPQANPVYTVTNASTSAAAIYTFEVTVTDVFGCAGIDQVTVEVKNTFDISLISPNSLSFTPNSPNQTLEAVPPGGTFSGVGVVQSNSSPVTYQFSPQVAHATDPNTLPKSFDIFYTVTQDGCTRTNYPIATFVISNSFFSTLQSQYCGDEYPSPSANVGVLLGLDASGHTFMENEVNFWNSSGRFSRLPQWFAGTFYPPNTYVRYSNTIYRCNGLGGCSNILLGPDLDLNWVHTPNALLAAFNGYIANFYEGYYGGNSSGPTIVKASSNYTVNGETLSHYRFGTNASYNECTTCNYAWPAAYVEFVNPADVRFMLTTWASNRTFFAGEIVHHAGNVYECVAASTLNAPPDSNPGIWTNITNSNYSTGYYFHQFDTSIGAFRAGYYVNGQFVQINRNPTTFFSGLTNGQDVCEFDVLDLDNPSTSPGIDYQLMGNFAGLGQTQSFSVKLDGAAVYNDGGGAIENDLFTAGKATFKTRLAFENSLSGATNLKNVEIRYQVDPGTDGSTGQPCFGTSSIVVQVLQNSTFDFDNSIVNANGSVYCYTEPTKDLQSLFNGAVINGLSGTPNSVSYSGFGVSDLRNSHAVFRPGAAVDQVSPGTTVQQSIPITAVYRDVNECRSTRERTFKVNPDINPSFVFGGRVNYCYEDIANALTGHVQDFTENSTTVSSTGNFKFEYKDPGGTVTELHSVNSNNASFTASAFYDEVQSILSDGNFTADLNQTVNINVVYTETLTATAVCRETFAQPMVINPPVMLDIFGLTEGDILCRNDNNNVAQGHIVTFEGSVTGSGLFKLDDDADFVNVNPSLNSTVNTLSGKATINLISAYNAASDPNDPRKVFLQYEYTAPGCTGPADAVKSFKISPPPALSYDTLNSPPSLDVFCNDDAPVQLQTVQNTNVTVGGYGITDSGTGSGVATFNPQLAFNTSVSNGGSSTQKQNITVTSRIVDGVGCVNVANIVYVVNPIPPKDVTFAKTDFCYEDAPANISSSLTKSWYKIEYLGVTTPHTQEIGSITAPVPQFSFDPKQRFNEATLTYGASALTPVNFNVTYYTADPDNCITSDPPRLVSVANQIDVTIAGIEADTYCSNENNGKKILTFNPFPADASKRQFLINGAPTTLSSDKFDFEPGLVGGDYLLRYIVFSGENNCSNTDTLKLKVLPSPEALFQVPPACNGDTIQFTAMGSNLSSAYYTWTLSDSVINGQTVEHRFPASNIYGVQLHVQYPAYNNDPSLVCQDSLRLDQTVGAVPQDLSFRFFNVCESDATTFELQPDVPISRFSWEFGDGVATGLGFSASNINPADVPQTTGTFQGPSHSYATSGNYDVKVTAKTADVFGGCELTENHRIAILTNWTPSAAEPIYDMSKIDAGRGYWVVEDAGGQAVWEFNTAAKKQIVTNEPAWVTGNTEPYNPGDNSYVNSPCFDLSGFVRPVFSLQHWTNTELSDGAVVQYSVDGGDSWVRLGDVASGLEWYDKLTISSNPGEQLELSSGWSHADQREWATGKHTLDDIPGDRKQVRFRVAFRSFNNREQLDGFAFNNVIIEERNRTILVENFTHQQFQGNNEAFKDFKADDNYVFNPAELVKLQYHHASAQGPDPDALHDDNPNDQDARAAFYGLVNPVRAFIDGGFGQSSTNATFEFDTTAVGNYFKLRSLVTSPVTITADFVSAPTDRLNILARVQATSDLGPPGQYNVFIAVAEISVANQVYVLRKFLPNAAGIPLTSLSPTDPEQEINVSYDMRHITRLQDGSFAPFAVIVFVQHLETKDVLQTVMRNDGTASPQIVTGVEMTYDNYLRTYPNPADDIVNIILPSPAPRSTPIRMFDTFGREVYSDAFETGQHVKILETKGLSTGVYLIQLATPQGVMQKKVMVVHH